MSQDDKQSWVRDAALQILLAMLQDPSSGPNIPPDMTVYLVRLAREIWDEASSNA